MLRLAHMPSKYSTVRYYRTGVVGSGSLGYSVLRYVKSGCADAGIVYLSNATISSKVILTAVNN